MVFVGAMEAFDELLKGAEFLRDGVEIFQTDDLPQGMRGLGRGAVGVEEVHASLISGVAIGDEAQGLVFGESARGLAQSHGGGQGIALRGEVIGRDVMPVGIEKEESVWVLTGDADIGFVAGGGVAERGFVAKVEGVAVMSGGLGVVEDGRVAEGHPEDSLQDLGGLAGGEGKRDVEGQHQAQHLGRTVQTGEVEGGPMGSSWGELGRLKMVFAIRVAQLELRAAELLEQLLIPVQRLLLLEVVGTALARAFVDGAVGTLLPAEKGAAAVGAPVRSFGGTMTTSDLRQAATDFAAQLAGVTAIVAVEEVARCAAVGTTTGGGQGVSAGTLNRRQRSAVLALVLNQQLPPVQSAGGRRGQLPPGSPRIDVEIAIVRMLLAKVVAQWGLGLTPGENLLQLIDQLLPILAGKFPTEPKYESWYLAHGGESLGNLAGSLHGEMGKRDSPAFFVFRQVPRRNSVQELKRGDPTAPHAHVVVNRAGRGEKAENAASSSNSRGYRLKGAKFLAVPAYP